MIAQTLLQFRADTSQARGEIKKLAGEERKAAEETLAANERRNASYESIAAGLTKLNAAMAVVSTGVSFAADAWKTYDEMQDLAGAKGAISIEGLRKASRGLKTDMELLRLAAVSQNTTFKLSQTQLEHATRAMKAFEDAGYDGLQVQRAMENAIKKGSIEPLKELGVNLELAKDATGRYNQLLEVLADKSEAAGNAELSRSDKMKQSIVEYQNAITELKSAVGELVLSFRPVISTVADLAKGIANLLSQIPDEILTMLVASAGISMVGGKLGRVGAAMLDKGTAGAGLVSKAGKAADITATLVAAGAAGAALRAWVDPEAFQTEAQRMTAGQAAQMGRAVAGEMRAEGVDVDAQIKAYRKALAVGRSEFEQQLIMQGQADDEYYAAVYRDVQESHARKMEIEQQGRTAQAALVAKQAADEDAKQKAAFDEARFAFQNTTHKAGYYNAMLRAAGDDEQLRAEAQRLYDEYVTDRDRRAKYGLDKDVAPVRKDAAARAREAEERARAMREAMMAAGERSQETMGMVAGRMEAKLRGEMAIIDVEAARDARFEELQQFVAGPGYEELIAKTKGTMLKFAAGEQQSALDQMFGPIEEFNAYGAAFGSLRDVATQAFASWTQGASLTGKAMRQLAADSLAGIAQDMFGKSIQHAAYAIGALALGGPLASKTAAQHGKAAAAFAAGSIIVGGLARKLNVGEAAGVGASGGAGSYGAGGAASIGAAGSQRDMGRITNLYVGDMFSDDNPRTSRQKFARLQRSARRELDAVAGVEYR